MDDIKRIRDKAVERMQATLESVEPVNLPYWVMMAIMFPVFMYEAIIMTLQMVWTLIRCSFHFVWVWVDMLTILWWFLKQIAGMLSK